MTKMSILDFADVVFAMPDVFRPYSFKLFLSSRAILLSFILVFVAACSDKDEFGKRPPSDVGVMPLQAQSIGQTEMLQGRLEASRIAEVRARVSGIVEKRLFTEGGQVKANQQLFQIDSALYQAQLASAQAQVAKAKAELSEAQYQAERYALLFEEKAISELENIQARARLENAQASLAAAKATLTNAKLNVEYSQVLSPIKGRIGRAFVTEGALVSHSAATVMAKVQQVDPMYINLQQNSQTLLQYLQLSANENFKLKSHEDVELEIILSNNSIYPHKGRLLFQDLDVDTQTGQLLLRAEIPNPDLLLLPGMYVQVRLNQASWNEAFLVPQKAVMRDDEGDRVMIVNQQKVIEVRPVKIEGSVNGKWLVSEGLNSGELLMLDGFQKAFPGDTVNPVFEDSNSPAEAESSNIVSE